MTVTLLLALSPRQATRYRAALRLAAMDVAVLAPSPAAAKRDKRAATRREMVEALALALAELHDLIPDPPTEPETDQ